MPTPSPAQPRLIRALLLLLLTLAALQPAPAHDLALSGIQIDLQPADTIVTVTTPISRLIRAQGKGVAELTPVQLDQAIRSRLAVRLDGRAPVTTAARVVGDNFKDRMRWQTTVPGACKTCAVASRLYAEDPGSRTVVTILRQGKLLQETVLDAAHPSLLPTAPTPTVPQVALRFVREGVLHIFGGPDHIMFVVGLLLLGGALRSLLRTVTAFTLAHSITLTLAATGVLSPPSRIVEPLIALSIVAVAVENLRHYQQNDIWSLAPRPKSPIPLRQRIRSDLRPFYAFGFGLVHGFGFAGALAEVGLPRAALGVALASFNIGVEIGQVTIILLALPGLAWLARHRPALFQRIVLAGSLFIGIAGAFWFAARLTTP